MIASEIAPRTRQYRLASFVIAFTEVQQTVRKVEIRWGSRDQQQTALVIRGREEEFLEHVEDLLDAQHLRGLDRETITKRIRRHIERHAGVHFTPTPTRRTKGAS